MEHFRIREWDGVKAVECVPMREAGFLGAFSTRTGGVSSLPERDLNLGYFAKDDPANVAENRRRFLKALDLEDCEIVTVKQIHSAEVCLVSDSSQLSTLSCDGLMTRRQRLLLGIQTADCLPILIVDTVQKVCAGAHAGWRGTLAGIAQKTLERMRETFGTRPEDCLVATGPAIGQCCFEVGPEVREQFERAFDFGRSLFIRHQTNGKAHMDLRMANHLQLLASGVLQERVYDWTDCTLCKTDTYFSYRGEASRGAVGRLVSVVGRL